MVVKFHKLDESTNDLFVAMYSDATLGSMPNAGSQGAYIILLASQPGKFSPIWRNSKKIRRVVRSTLAAATMAMADGIDASIFICTLLGELISGIPDPTSTPIVCFTDCKSLHDALKSQKHVSEKRLRLEMSGIKELMECCQIRDVKWCDTHSQLANCLTKKGASSSILRKALGTGSL